MMFSIWNGNTCLSWDETKEWADLLGLHMVPELYRGPFYPEIAQGQQTIYNGGFEQEGFVLRLTESFRYSDFPRSVAKYVRAGHLQTSHNWRRETKVQNKLTSV